MRIALPMLAFALAVAGCSLSAGAGVGARLGNRPGEPSSECDNFESCDIAYREALTNAERCHEDSADCDDEERNVAATYAELREQTQLELAALRNEAGEKDTALAEAEEAADAARREKRDCSPHAHPVDPAPAPRHGSGWFDSDRSAH